MKPAFIWTSVLSFALLVVACGGGGAATQRPSVAAPTTAPVTAAPATAAPATVAPATAAAQTPAMSAGAGGETVMLATTDLGEIVVDGEGMTLYGFVPDQAEGEVTCYETCAENWPPLSAPEAITVGEGLDATMFSAVPRTDDMGDQVQFGEFPLYHFAGDSAVGDTNGQGLNDVWFVVGADGELITE